MYSRACSIPGTSKIILIYVFYIVNESMGFEKIANGVIK